MNLLRVVYGYEDLLAFGFLPVVLSSFGMYQFLNEWIRRLQPHDLVAVPEFANLVRCRGHEIFCNASLAFPCSADQPFQEFIAANSYGCSNGCRDTERSYCEDDTVEPAGRLA